MTGPKLAVTNLPCIPELVDAEEAPGARQQLLEELVELGFAIYACFVDLGLGMVEGHLDIGGGDELGLVEIHQIVHDTDTLPV